MLLTTHHVPPQGLNTGVFLLRKCEWSRQLMAEVAALATPSIRRQIGNKGRIAEQGALTWVLHSQASKWKDRTLLERNFTMNGNWMDYAGKWQKGQRRLTQPVWGQDQIPFVVQYAGCQMCRGHSENGSWHDQGVRKCQSAFLEAYTFGDDQALHPLGLRHLTMDTHLVRSLPSSELYQRHMRMTRCLPRFLVIGTQKGGTSSFHFLLKSGWHDDVQMNSGEKEIHYFSWDENFRKGPLVYQQRFDGSGDRLGVCSDETKTRGEVSATYLDYPKAAERAAQLLPSAKIVILLREPTSRLVSSFNMKWQVQTCSKLTLTLTLILTTQPSPPPLPLTPTLTLPRLRSAASSRGRATTATTASPRRASSTRTTWRSSSGRRPWPCGTAATSTRRASTTPASPTISRRSSPTRSRTRSRARAGTWTLTRTLTRTWTWTLTLALALALALALTLTLTLTRALSLTLTRTRSLSDDCLVTTWLQVKRLGQCTHSGVEDMGACLGINGLDQTRLYAMMEDSLFVYRSMYVEHINRRAVSTVIVSAVVDSIWS